MQGCGNDPMHDAEQHSCIDSAVLKPRYCAAMSNNLEASHSKQTPFIQGPADARERQKKLLYCIQSLPDWPLPEAELAKCLKLVDTDGLIICCNPLVLQCWSKTMAPDSQLSLLFARYPPAVRCNYVERYGSFTHWARVCITPAMLTAAGSCSLVSVGVHGGRRGIERDLGEWLPHCKVIMFEPASNVSRAISSPPTPTPTTPPLARSLFLSLIHGILSLSCAVGQFTIVVPVRQVLTS